MAYGGYGDYVKLGFRPDKDEYLIADFTTIPARGKTAYQAAEAIAAESSIGTWTKLSTMQKGVLKHLQPKVFEIKKRGRGAFIRIAYPLDIFEGNNAPQLLSDIAGNIFGMKEIDALRFEDFHAPKRYLDSYPGPAFGRDGVRKIAKTLQSRRPHLGTIVKPKVGLSPKEQAKVAYESWAGGLDFVKDDENLTSHPFSRFEERLVKMLDAADRAADETGSPKIYAPNITASAEIMLKRADYVKAHGGNCMMIDVITAGMSGLQFMRSQNNGLFIHAHRAMHAAFTRNKEHGMSMKAYAKLCRMTGVDQLHIGAIFGKMEGGKEEVLAIHKDMNEPFGGYKPVFSVYSGGLSPLKVPDIMKVAGIEVVIQAGGGVHGHPMGTRAGAKAMVQAYESAKKKVPMKEYAKTHEELRLAIEKWEKVKV